MDKMLPIGTIVTPFDSKEDYVIIGRINDNGEYKYVCVVYPYGYIESKDFTYFKDSEINKIVFLGDINY